MTPKIACVVTICDLDSPVTRCLDSLFNQTARNDVVVVNNGVPVAKLGYLDRYRGRIKLVHSKKNIGVAAARNLGIAAVGGEYICLIDDDAYLETGALAGMTRYMVSQPQVAVVGPRVVDGAGAVQLSCRRFPRLVDVLYRGLKLETCLGRPAFYRDYLMADIGHRQVRPVDWVVGACQLLRRSVYDELGGLDMKYFYGYEDVDYCYRVRRLGYEVAYLPTVQAVHRARRRSGQRLVNRYTWHHTGGIVRFIIKRVRLEYGNED